MPEQLPESRVAALRRALAGLLGTPVDALRERTGAARGSGGRSFVATSGGRVLHVKLVAAGSLRTITIEEERALLEALRPAGIAPAPVAADAAQGLIVTEQLEQHRPLAAAEVRQPGSIAAIAALLASLHRSGVSLSGPPAAAVAGAYAMHTTAAAAADGQARPLDTELRTLAAWFGSWPEPEVVCHGDLVADNILRPANRAPGPGHARDFRLVDFEYAVPGPPVWDLASLSVMNRFDADADASLLARYYATGPMAFDGQDFAKVRRLVALVADFWSRAQGRSDADVGRFRLDAAGPSD